MPPDEPSSHGSMQKLADEAFAVAAIHFQAQDIDPFAVAVEFPRDEHSGGGTVAERLGVSTCPEWQPQKNAKNAKARLSSSALFAFFCGNWFEDC